MQPGIYPDLDARDYHALPGASASRLRKLWQSTPGHLKAEMDAPRENTPALKLGTLAHAVILEPDKPLPDPEQFLTRSLLDPTLKEMGYVPTKLDAPSR